MKTRLVIIAAVLVALAIPAVASGTLTEIGSIGLPFGKPSPVGATGPTGKKGTNPKSGKPNKKNGSGKKKKKGSGNKKGASGKTGASGVSGSTGTTGTTGPVGPTAPLASCPGSPCEVVSETTGLQVNVDSHTEPMTIPRNGVIVAWTIHLSSPSTSQIAYFDQHEGGPAEAGIAILKYTRALNYTLVAQSPLVQLQPYFGGTAQFPLASPIPVQKGERVALTVPTWAPALAIKLGNTTSWRASRPKNTCTNAAEASTQTSQTTAGSSVQYACLYQTARLLYTATLISTP